MINHARNLLLNIPYVEFKAHVPLEEIIDPAYKVRTLPTHLANVRRALFGETPDRYMLNYRTRQLLSIVHSTELSEFLTDLDSRITYTLTDDTYFLDQSIFALNVDQYFGATNELALVGTAWAPDKRGQMMYTWDMTYLSGETTVRNNTSLEESVTVPSFVERLSEPITLVGSPLAVRHYDSPAKWTISYLAKPERTVHDLELELSKLGPSTLTKLFGIGSSLMRTEPYKTLYSIWATHKQSVYRLAAAVVALIYQTEVIRE